MKASIEMARHNRDSSLSSVNDIGALTDEHSLSDLSTDQNRRMHIAILASSSPEIRALSCRNSISLCSTSASSTQSSKDFEDYDETKCPGDGNYSSCCSKKCEQLTSSLENLRVNRTARLSAELADVTKLIEFEKENNAPGRSFQRAVDTVADKRCQMKRPLYRRAHSAADYAESNTLFSPSQPIWDTSMQSSADKRLNLHRRVSMDSLPSPSEIEVSEPTSPPWTATRRSFQHPRSVRGGKPIADVTTKPRHRRNTEVILAPKSANLIKEFL